jgi:hypothetical protein
VTGLNTRYFGNLFIQETKIDFVFTAVLHRDVRRMGRGGRDRMGHRGAEGFGGHGIRGSYDDRRDPVNPDQDPSHDLRDIYEDPADPAGRDYLWPENEEDDD